MCCRTNAAGRTTATLRRPGRCPAQAGGSSCESDVPYLNDACKAGGCATLPVCGNGIVETGEFCDGEDFCSPECAASFGACCSLAGGGFCLETDVAGANACMTSQGSFAIGALCAGEPCPNGIPGCHLSPCVSPPIPPTSVCCQIDAGGCTALVASALGALATFAVLECSGVGTPVIGTCDGAGQCVPRS